jgi:hypothetical protein
VSAARPLLLALLVLAGVAEALLAGALRPSRGADIVALELAPSAQAFTQAVQRHWTQDAAGVPVGAEPACGLGLPHAAQASPRPAWGQLRCNLLVDSLALVPGYVGLLLVFTLACVAPGAPTRRRVAWGMAALLAGLLDLAENGLMARALDAHAHAALTDASVAAMRHASQAKWLALAAALAALGHVAWHAPAAARSASRRAAALACLLGAAALPAGVWLWRPAVALGMVAMVLAFALLAWGRWRVSARATASTPASPP